MCICLILLESLSRLCCCAFFNVAARILDAAMAIPTVMARLVGFVSLNVAWMVAHRLYSINVQLCYFTRITLTVILLCCFQGFSHYFGGSDSMVTAMARLVGFVSLNVARMVAHRYV